MTDLNIFKTKDFLSALKELFTGLNIPVSYFDTRPTTPQEILGNLYKPENITHKLVKDVYVLGLVDDRAFEGVSNIDFDSVENDYPAIMILGITLDNLPDGKNPSRTQIAELTRIFNRISKGMPVLIVFKYNDCIALANTERLKYKQEWREGEKVGKVSILKDVYLNDTHRGHISVLESLKINTNSNNRAHNFIELYYHWQTVLSISILNKKFYEEIIAWFNTAIAQIRIPGEEAGSEKHKDFVVRLISRIIFVWFLKELKVVKEELLIPKFTNGTINELIKPKEEGSSYYKFILQNLFFNALNEEKELRDQSVFDIYSHNFNSPDEIKENIFFSPYLNGGLFDIHENDWCKSDRVNNDFVVSDSLFLDFESGLNSILSRFKFTLAENTPVEEEIAVDPEMLGRIFENLLAEQSDDTKEAARSSVGAFYTPRPVVSYMCKSTLQRHLNIEIKPENGKAIVKKLLNTTVLDPACGSGAFPMGMLEEMMNILDIIDPEGNLWIGEILKSKDENFLEHISEFIADKQYRYVKKLGILKNCLFGIDILEYAIEITKLRAWLSLIVDQKVDHGKPNFNLKPLPNLDFKFYSKNSLYRFYKEDNLNDFVFSVDKNGLLEELIDLENNYFILKSSEHGTKEDIKNKISELFKKVSDSKLRNVQNELNQIPIDISYQRNHHAPEREIKKLEKKQKELAKQLDEYTKYSYGIQDYFIERIVYPGIFNKENKNPGFDIVIGNPPYVNTKLISKMGQKDKLIEEYGYCDDLYNHFTIRGLELTKLGGLLSYITSDTFLTLQTKKNMREEFLGIPKKTLSGDGIFTVEQEEKTECSLIEIINTPKAFSALVNTAIFTVKKEHKDDIYSIYIDLRKPGSEMLGISVEEWEIIKKSKENLNGWERVLQHCFGLLSETTESWKKSHECDNNSVSRDENSKLLKYLIPMKIYKEAINYAIFSPTPYNSQILDKIIKPAKQVFEIWWDKISTSRLIDYNRVPIQDYIDKIQSNSISLIGILTDGGQGLATGNNGRFVGYRPNTRFAENCRSARAEKLWIVIQNNPEIINEYPNLNDCDSKDNVVLALSKMDEQELWELFEKIKVDYNDLRIFGKGFLYRIVPEELIYDTTEITADEKTNGIEGNKYYVPYDKGDKEGNRWYTETPYLIDWSVESVSILRNDYKARWQGTQFFFRNGFCWSDVLDPSNPYIKCRLKGCTVNDIKSMSLYDESGYGDKFLVTNINSKLFNRVLREFFNGTVAIQINDIRKLPIKIPDNKQLEIFNAKFDECLEIKKRYFSGEIDRAEMKAEIYPIEKEVDKLVNEFYGITDEEIVEPDDDEIFDSVVEEQEDENEE